jgi:hypothetical protein
VGEQLALGIAHQAEEKATKFAQKARNKHIERETLRAERHRFRAERRAARARQKWEKKFSRTSEAEGWTYGGLAVLLIVLMVLHVLPQWWFIFIIIGLTLRAAQIIGYHKGKGSREDAEQDEEIETEVASDSRAARIDEVCSKLKASLKDAPASVREFLSKPEETVDSLRKTTHELLKRELALRALISPAEIERLSRERNALRARIETEPDDIIRQRLSGALAALENQQKQHADVQRSADRLEAERTRLIYTLEGLYAQVMRVKTADTRSPELGAGLRVSLDQLREEVGALADAVEQVNRANFEAPETFGESVPDRSSERTR